MLWHRSFTRPYRPEERSRPASPVVSDASQGPTSSAHRLRRDCTLTGAIERRSTQDATRSARSSERARRVRESSQRMCPYVYVSSAEVGRRRRPKEACVRTSLGDPEVEPM